MAAFFDKHCIVEAKVEIVECIVQRLLRDTFNRCQLIVFESQPTLSEACS